MFRNEDGGHAALIRGSGLLQADGLSLCQLGQHLALVYQDIFAAPLPHRLQALVDQIEGSDAGTMIGDDSEPG